jgi:hypothetical protein
MALATGGLVQRTGNRKKQHLVAFNAIFVSTAAGRLYSTFQSETVRKNMEQQDFLKRQIDQIGRILGKILADFIGLKNKGLINEGIELTSQSLKSELDLDVDGLITIPTDQFISTLIRKKNLTNGSLHKLAEMLLLIADSRQENTKKLYEKCITIYEYLEKVENVYSLDRQWKIERIKNVL